MPCDDLSRRTGLDDAVPHGTATVGGHRVVVAVMNFSFDGTGFVDTFMCEEGHMLWSA
ncbi:hypothetical protein [Streptosporangium sp. NPDC006930]|uniref:hypothetical protein n=1 Tax=unclassified Streptosporangium TaxID=2632669 RepID=UPI003445A948